ncbi:MAG TPA: bifunctional homocysteine S-methyltransferase/methylenetetrahydrofolate reductase, partial [Syntrophomonas sp.]|nr:bifunctional homocysteine S-methyltransferase/methylenetetrahydrofolate reductase [Syntrophomonas sp.]
MRQSIEQPYIFDGAMGTYYASRAVNPVSPCELANLYDPATIVSIHREYISAGCQAIKTNTFGANRISLNRDFETVREVICRGYRLAEEAVRGTQVQVFADIGPIPGDDTADIGEQYQEIVNVFLDLGASHFIFETFSSADDLLEVSQYIKDHNPQAYILAEFAVSPEGLTRMGISGHQLLEKVWQWPSIDACGFNCYSGPSHLLEYIKTFDIRDKIISVMPNSGYPTTVNNRIYFNNSKEYFAGKMLELA